MFLVPELAKKVLSAYTIRPFPRTKVNCVREEAVPRRQTRKKQCGQVRTSCQPGVFCPHRVHQDVQALIHDAAEEANGYPPGLKISALSGLGDVGKTHSCF